MSTVPLGFLFQPHTLPLDAILLSQKKALLCDLGVATGIAESQRPDAPAATRLSGSRNYRAPEQLEPGTVVDHRADIFAWGCTAYEMLTGLPAFPRDSLRQSGAPVVDDDPAPITLVRRDVPTALTRLIMRAMSTSPFSSTRRCVALSLIWR